MKQLVTAALMIWLPIIAAAQPASQSSFKTGQVITSGQNDEVPSETSNWCDDSASALAGAAAAVVAQGCKPRPVSRAYPMPIASSQLATPGSGADASSAAPSALALLATLTVNSPGAYRVQNQSGATVQMQLCPAGTLASATSTCTTYLLAGGAGANAQGADSSPEVPWFTGVIFVHGAAGAQVAGRSN